MTKKTSVSQSDVKLPPEVYLNEGTSPRVVKWPTRLYDDFYKICQITGNSITKVVISLVRNFVNENKQLLEDKK